MQASETQADALDRARNGTSTLNYAAIMQGFQAKGIAAHDIKPRDNVLTFHAWKAVGRVVMKGQHGVKVETMIPIKDKDTGDMIGKRFASSTVFHITQTKELGARETRAWRGASGATHDASKFHAEDNAAPGNVFKPAPIEPTTADSSDRWINS